MSAPVAVIIEDEPQIRRFVRSALEAEGWQVHEAGTAQRGLTEAGTRKPDLLVLDLARLFHATALYERVRANFGAAVAAAVRFEGIAPFLSCNRR